MQIVIAEYAEAVAQAWANLARYEFSNFGYWSSRVVYLGQLLAKLGEPQPPNPFRELVRFASGVQDPPHPLQSQ